MNFLCQKIMYYDYEKLKDAALSRPSEENLEALATWFENFGAQYWNGDSWEIDKNHSLRPVFNGDYSNYQII